VETLAHPHWEALTPATAQAFHLAGAMSLIPRFYLAGRTGLALHLGHRFSVGLDFFSPDPQAVNASDRAALRRQFDDPTLAITFDSDATFVAWWRGVGVSFFRLDLYPLAQPPLILDGVPLAAIEEIGAMKLAAAIDRGTRKDMVDLYFILQQVSLESLFEAAAVKYARVRTFAVSAVRALAYFEDVEALPMPRMLDRTPWPKMKKFLEQEAARAGRAHLEDLWEGKV
jgi:hypothetical protein